MKAYKVFNPDWTCKNFQYEVGKTYQESGKIVLCGRGFHACERIQDCFSYYSFNPENKIAEVEMDGEVFSDGNKTVASKITIIKELSWNEMLNLANTGKGNTGYSNSGYSNSGHRNSGHRNSGDRNSGYSNSGYSNSGHRNSGHSNSGHSNSGDRNSGYSNSGDRNSGYSNSGYSNSGHRNSGDFNSSNFNNGFFNSVNPENINVFNKSCKKKVWDNCIKPIFLYRIELNKWVCFDDMCEKEKVEFPKAFVCDGYLKTISHKEAWKEAFKSASNSDIDLLKKLPNFNAKVFEEITGIEIK